MTGPQGMGPLISGDTPALKSVPIGPLAVIEVLEPRIYHTLDAYDPTDLYIDYGTANVPMKPFNLAQGLSAPPHPLTEQPPFESAGRLTVANNDCYTTQTVTYDLLTTGATTYSAFVKLADAFPRAGSNMVVFGNTHEQMSFARMESQLTIGVNGEISWTIYTTATLASYASSDGVIPNDQEWHMISLVYTPSLSVRMYVDGWPVQHIHGEQTTIIGVKNDATIEKSWGARSNSNNETLMNPVNPLNGWIAHGFVVTRALTDDEIRSVYEGAFMLPSQSGPPFVIGAGTPQWQLGDAVMTVPVPPGSEAGHTLFMQVSSRNSATTFAGLSAWTLVDHSSVSGTTSGVDMSEIWTRTASGAASYPITPSGFDWHGAYIVACSEVTDISTVQKILSNASSPINGNRSPITVAPSGAVVLSFIAYRFGNTPDSSLVTTYSSPPWTQLISTIYPGPNAQAMGCAWARGRGAVPVAPGAQWKYTGTIEARPSHIVQFYLT